jgi:esterase FrsA
LNDVDELKQFAVIHARAQQIAEPALAGVLGRIEHDDEGPGSWVGEWSRAAAVAESGGDLLGASRLFTMARFPYVDGAARQEALSRAQGCFERWVAREGAGLWPLNVELPGGRVRAWTSGRPGTDGPYALLMGGIVSTKEQWAPTLLRLRRFGISGLVTEMPGAGANTLRYDSDSPLMLSALLDEVGVVAGPGRAAGVHAMAMSFSGHLALSAAPQDARIRSLITVGAPIHDFFTDAAWQRALPRVTVETLAHQAGVKPDELGERLRGRAFAPSRLAELDLPIAYVASRRDEIIPASDIRLLKRHTRRLSLLEHDDVHASPAHTATTGPWLVLSLLRAARTRALQRAVLRGAIPPLRALDNLRSRDAAHSRDAAQSNDTARSRTRIPSTPKGN